MGQTGFDRRHHRQKNNKIIGISPSQTLPALTPHQPAVHELVDFTPFFLFNSPHLSSSPPFFSSPPLSSYSTPPPPFSTSQTNYPTNSPSALLTQTFLNSINSYIVTSTVYLAFIWRLFKQMVYWLRNAFIHVSVNMSEVLCKCWG